MRSVSLVGVILIFGGIAAPAGIRQFDVPTTERLGNELFYRDHIAAHTSDLILSQHPELKKIWQQTWVSQLHKNEDVIYWCAQTKNELVPEYKVTYPKKGGVHVEGLHGQELPGAIIARFRARETGMKAAWSKLSGAYGAHYNFEVLDDPDGRGFLVYALAATNKQGEEIYGGHIRVTVSADGTKAERVDELSKGILKSKPGPPGATPVAFATYDPIGKVPVETWIYSHRLYNLPLMVGTEDGLYWEIAGGKLRPWTKAEIDKTVAKEKKK
jgi:hypothetical protein